MNQVQNFTSAPMLYFDGKQTLYAVAVVMSRQWASIGFPSLLQISQTNNLQNPTTGWNDYSIYTRPGTVQHGANNESLLRVTIGGDAILVTVDAQDLNAAAAEFSLFMPIPPTQIKITLRGVKRRRCTT
jgi:hypothetical protein